MRQDAAVADLTAISINAHSRERRVAARLLVKAVTTEVLRGHILELMVVVGQEVGFGVARELEHLAKEFGLLPSPRDRLMADLRGSL